MNFYKIKKDLATKKLLIVVKPCGYGKKIAMTKKGKLKNGTL